MRRENRTHRLLVVEFYLTEDGKYQPFNVITWRHDKDDKTRGLVSHYDVDYCKRDKEFIYHCSGGGGSFEQEVSGIYWASKDAVIKEEPCNLFDEKACKRNATRRLTRWPKGFGLLRDDDAEKWLYRLGSEDDTVYCDICEDHLPSQDLCAHVWWCEEVGWYVPTDGGEVDRTCRCEDCVEGRKVRRKALMRLQTEKLTQRTGPIPLPA